MALSGSLNTSTWQGTEQNGALQFSWSATQSIEDNTSAISWTLKGVVNESWIMAGGFKVVIDGETVYSKDTDYRIKLYNGTVVASGTKTIAHNADGTRSFSVSVQAGIYTFAVNVTGSKTFSLDTIPRASTIRATDADIESTSIISIVRNSDAFTTTVSYKAAGQSSYTTIWTKQKHSSYGWTVPASLYTIMVKLRKIEIELRCQTYNGDTLLGTSYGSMFATAAADKCQPEATISAKDIRSATVGLTGNNRRIIKGVSTLEATVTSKAIKSATLVDTTVTCGSQQQVSTSNPFVATFAKAESATATSATKDSRDYVTWKKDDLTLVNYITPTVNPLVERDGPTSNVVNISVSGIWFNGSFGAVTNSITAKVRSKPKSQAQYTDAYTSMAVTPSGNEYTASAQLTGLEYTNAYDVEIVVTDKVYSGSIEPVITKYDEVRKGIPIFDWGENDFNVNGALMVNGTLNVSAEAEKTNKCVVRKYWWGSSGATHDTGIAAKGESYGKTILMVLSAHSGNGTATTSEVGMIWCGFDSGTIVYTCLGAISAGGTVSSQFTFTVGDNGNIHLKGNRPVIAMTAIVSD